MNSLDKRNGFVVLSLILLCILSACATSESAGIEGGTNEEETYTLTFHSSYPPSVHDWEPKYYAQEKFIELVEERTDGRVTFDVYYSNQLVGQDESADALANGTIDIQNISPSYWAERIPEGNLVSLPYWNMGEEHALHILRETEVGELYEDALDDYGIKLLHYWPSSTTGYMSTTPLSSIEDMEGVVMNVSSNLTIDYNQSMGSGIASLPAIDQYEGLYRGTIDAIQFPYYALETYSLVDTVDYLAVPTLNPAMTHIVISQESWEKLPEDIQDIMLETGQEMEEAAIEGSQRYTQEVFEFAENHGVEFVSMTEDDYERMEQMSQEKVWDNFASINNRTAQMIEHLMIENEKWMEENPEAEDYMDQYLD
ncbi:TRAP transporter substrate-binding protein [Salicibibacter cibi]|uniref:TRAP transporter substrate-binding protein n=1 Tax=Salicibibacter cibi TaxID=2743001 RepID=A0A7T7CFP7_9BACI|nr:TRAP transporter substrate-binding protein [Salicibibacter cibi]QQK80314.1 TRAP transporter substrate-binding protein [Salicibibacter cibi]